MQPAIITANLCRSFSGADAVRSVSLEVPAGSIYGFLGPNGAGKTTTIRMLTGLLRPSSGTITVLGLPMPRARIAIARRLGALVETPSLYDHLTGRENLDISRRLLGLPLASIDEALDMADLLHAGGVRVGAYSLGMRQRLALSRALLGEPRLLILDEPGNGLDPDGIRDLRDMLRRLAAQGMTIFVSSHQLAEVQQIATHIGVMLQGRLLAQGRLTDVLGGGNTQVEIRVDRPADAKAVLGGAAQGVHLKDGLVIAEVASRESGAAEIIERLVRAGFRLAEVRCSAPSLEDLYVDLTNAGTNARARAQAA